MRAKRLKSIIAPLSATGLVLASLVVASPAHAADSNAGDIATLQAAATGCTAGDTVTLIADINAPTEQVYLGCADFTIDLNGFSMNVRSVTLSGGMAYTLTIRDTAGGGSLTADGRGFSNPGIDISQTAHTNSLVVQSGTVTAYGGTGAAGIGGRGFIASNGGIVTVHGGTVTAYGGDSAAGIGGGDGGDGISVTVNGGTVNAYAGDDGAGIGGGYGGDGGNVTITGGVVNANGGIRAAGIGGGFPGGSGTILISGGTVTAVGGQQAAGIGGSYQGSVGTITVSGGSVTATGGVNGAGIGSGYDGTSGAVLISGGTVAATGGDRGSGIGGGYTVDGGVVTVSGGSVMATGGTSAFGIGGGTGAADGTALTISGGSVTAVGGPLGMTAIYLAEVGTLDIGGVLRLPSTPLVIADTTLGPEIHVLATGRIEGTIADPTVGGSFLGDGQVLNDGVITLSSTYVEAMSVTVQSHNYLVTFNSQGGAPTPSPVRVYATTFVGGLRPFPADPTKGGLEFSGWFTNPAGTGTPVTASTVLSADVTLYAGWVLASTGSSAAPLIPWAAALVLVGAGLLVVRRRLVGG